MDQRQMKDDLFRLAYAKVHVRMLCDQTQGRAGLQAEDLHERKGRVQRVDQIGQEARRARNPLVQTVRRVGHSRVAFELFRLHECRKLPCSVQEFVVIRQSIQD